MEPRSQPLPTISPPQDPFSPQCSQYGHHEGPFYLTQLTRSKGLHVSLHPSSPVPGLTQSRHLAVVSWMNGGGGCKRGLVFPVITWAWPLCSGKTGQHCFHWCGQDPEWTTWASTSTCQAHSGVPAISREGQGHPGQEKAAQPVHMAGDVVLSECTVLT